MKRVFLAIPTYNNQVHSTCLMGAICASSKHVMQISVNGSSLLAHGFNLLWTSAVTSTADYWAMCHADIGPEHDWLDTMIDELEATGADMLSANVPIKGPHNDYSTALAPIGQEAVHRLNVSHLADLPETFGTEDLQRVTGGTGVLCVNSGLWVCRLQQPWNKRVHFQIRTWIDWVDEKPICRIIPEDWDFSQQLHTLGLRVMATSKVRLVHSGEYSWQSRPPQ